LPRITTELIGFVIAKIEVFPRLIVDTDINFGTRKKLVLFNKRESNTTFGNNFLSIENIFHRYGCRKILIKALALIMIDIFLKYYRCLSFKR